MVNPLIRVPSDKTKKELGGEGKVSGSPDVTFRGLVATSRGVTLRDLHLTWKWRARVYSQSQLTCAWHGLKNIAARWLDDWDLVTSGSATGQYLRLLTHHTAGRWKRLLPFQDNKCPLLDDRVAYSANRSANSMGKCFSLCLRLEYYYHSFTSHSKKPFDQHSGICVFFHKFTWDFFPLRSNVRLILLERWRWPANP